MVVVTLSVLGVAVLGCFLFAIQRSIDRQNVVHAELVELLTSHGLSDPEGVPWSHHMDLAGVLLGKSLWPGEKVGETASEPYDELLYAVSARYWPGMARDLPVDEYGFALFCGARLVPAVGRLPKGFVRRDSDEGQAVLAGFVRLCDGLVSLNDAAAVRLGAELTAISGGGFASDAVLEFAARH